MKKTIVIAMLIGAVLTLFGCGTTPVPDTPLIVSISPDSGHPPFDVTVTCSGKTGGEYVYKITGQEAVSSTDSTFNATVDRWPWKCVVTWIDGNKTATKTVVPSLVNQRPIAHDLHLSHNTPEYHEDILIDLRYLQRGCLNGMPVSYSGIEDPDHNTNGYSMDNDGFLYNVRVYDKAAGERETVFRQDRTVLNDEFVADTSFRWFPGWTQTIPPYPFIPKCEPTPPSLSSSPIATIAKLVHVYVKEFGSAYHWVYEVKTSGCACKRG